MNKMSDDLNQLRFIRSIQASSLKRQQKACDLLRQQARQKIMDAENEIVQMEGHIITLQRESLAALTNGNLVRVEQLLAFNRNKLKQLKKVIDSKMQLNDHLYRKYEIEQQYLDLNARAVAAEKKLIGLDEAISGMLWK